MDIAGAIPQNAANPALVIAAALLLGALHGLEPGHSKTMIAAFVIAVRGTVAQAVLLGLSAAVSHSIVVWVLAVLALRYGNALIGEDLEPVLAIASGGLIIGVAIWIFLQTWLSRRANARLSLAAHHRSASARDPGHHHHDRDSDGHARLNEDGHARAHAADIDGRFAGGRTTTWQTILFGLSGGLIPCAAAIPVLILCLNLGKFWLGIGLVSAFSVGLAATLVAAGVAAAIGIRYASKHTRRLDALFGHAPYVSAAIIVAIGAFMIQSGLAHPHAHAS